MGERWGYIAETPRWVSGDRIRLPCVSCIVTEASRFVNTLVVAELDFSNARYACTRKRLGRLPASSINKRRNLARNSNAAAVILQEYWCMHIFCTSESTGGFFLTPPAQCTAPHRHMQSSNSTRLRLTAINTRRQLTSGFPRMGQTTN